MTLFVLVTSYIFTIPRKWIGELVASFFDNYVYDASSIEFRVKYLDIEDIKSFGEVRDKQSLKDFITSKYLKSPYYNANGKILNTWLNELVNEDIDDPNSFVNNIDFNRSLGNTNKEFKKFSKQEQYLQLLNNFFSERQIHNRGEVQYINRESFDNNLKSGTLNPKTRYNINHTNKVMVSQRKHDDVVWIEQTRDDYAFYHTFVLGDSGISKFMKARRYSNVEILENTKPGSGGEIQLTDALKELAKIEDMIAYEFEGKRYDVGDKLGFLQATVEFALKNDEFHNILGEQDNITNWKEELKKIK